MSFLCLVCACLCAGSLFAQARDGKSDNSPDWFYPRWAATAPYNRPIMVRDTDSALGRYSLRTKEIGLKDLVRVHGHLCDGLAIAFVGVRTTLDRLFPDKIVDRTDLRAVSRNGPCWIDAVAIMTGARINFQTLRVDNGVGDGFIIQRISTREAYEVRLKPGVFPSKQAELENRIRRLRAEGKIVTAEEISDVEHMADALTLRVLSSPPTEILDLRALPGYVFRASDLFGERGDIINRQMPR